MPGLTRELGIDLGTMNTVITEGHQILLQEPTVVALIVQEQKMVEWGQSARDMLGRVSDSIEVVRPLRHGVIAEFEITENLLQYLIKKTCGPMLIFRPRIIITVPYGITSVETRAVHEAGLGSGSRDVLLIKQPLAAALGIDLPINTPTGNMIISLGGGTHQAAVLAMNDIVTAETSRTGGIAMDEAIISYVRRKYGIKEGSRLVFLEAGEEIRVLREEDLARMFPHLEFEIEDDLLLWHGGDIHCTAERENALKTIALAEFHFCNDYDYFYKNYFKPKTETKC